LDALRGFALFGILMVNGPLYGLTLYHDQVPTPSSWTSVDNLAHFVIGWLFESKFFVLFSFLFGYGTAMQMRSEGLTASRPRLTRRMLALIVLGVLNGTFLFSGDILTVYGVLGLGFLYLLAPWLGDRPRRAGALAVGLLALQALIDLATALPWVHALLAFENPQALIETAREAYRSENLWNVAQHRHGDYRLSLLWELTFMAPLIVACIVAGWAAASTRFLESEPFDLWARLFGRSPQRRLRAGLLVLTGLVGAFGYAWTSRRGQTFAELGNDPLAGPLYASHVVASLALATGYVGMLAALERTTAGRVLYRLLAPLGRMSLSAYLAESLLASLVFCGYGLGLYDRLGAGTVMLIGFGIYAAVLTFAHIWFRYARIGPVEWLLRSVTYLRLQALW
jgi:uncharacterized protein